jgi:hypothetical protein
MKNLSKALQSKAAMLRIAGLTALVAVTGFSMIACGGGGGGGGGGNSPTVGDGKMVFYQAVYVAANPGKGFNYGYWYWIPKSIQNAPKKYLLVEPNNAGASNDGSDIEFLKDQARSEIIMASYLFADEYVEYGQEGTENLGVAILLPVFPRPDGIYTHSLNRDTMLIETGPMARLDLQLIKMVEDLKERCQAAGINLEEKFLMDGYSASGQFVNRFTAMHPELVHAAAAGGVSGMPILPVDTLKGERLIYTVGIADLQEITGKPFNLEQFKKVPQFIYMGADDKNDTLAQHYCFSDEEYIIINKVLLDGRYDEDRTYEIDEDGNPKPWDGDK